MTAYVLTGLVKSGQTIIAGQRNAIVHAPSAAVAKRIASKHVENMSASYWEASTATAISAATNWAGWTCNISVIHPTSGATVESVSSVAVDTIDNLCAALVTALNGTESISNASYNSTSQVLTVAAIADGLGDHYLYVDMVPPNKTKPVNNMMGSKVNLGIAGAVLTQAFPADAYAVPKVIATLKGV